MEFIAPNSFEDIPVDCEANEEFNDLDMPTPFPFDEWNWFTTSLVENIGIVGDVETDPTAGPLSFDC